MDRTCPEDGGGERGTRDPSATRGPARDCGQPRIAASATNARWRCVRSGETGKLVFSDMASAPATPGLIIGFLLIFAALGFKIGAVPFHTWIPDTYHGAPTPVTAFLSIAPKGAAIAILLRLFFVALFAFKPMWVLLLAALPLKHRWKLAANLLI